MKTAFTLIPVAALLFAAAASAQTSIWRCPGNVYTNSQAEAQSRGCKVVETDPKGRWDVREHILKTPLQMVRSVFRSDLEPNRRMTFRRVDGDMRILEGEWTLEALDGGRRTRVSHEMRMQPGFSAPGMMVRSFVRGEVSAGLANLRRESEAAARS